MPDEHLYRPAVSTASKHSTQSTIAPSTTSTLSLASELALAKERFNRERQTKSSRPSRPEKKRTIWESSNKGVAERNARDERVYKENSDEMDRSRRALERKAKEYERLRKGEDRREDDAVVDFDRKWAEEEDKIGYHDEKEAEEEYEEPKIEITDEFGRTRLVSRSDAVAYGHLAPINDTYKPSAPLIHGDVIQTNAFTLNTDAVAKIWSTPDDPLYEHYNSKVEIRNKGVGHFTFSVDEAERVREMEELKGMREETERARVKVKGMREVRREELDERRRKIEEVRKRSRAGRGHVAGQ
ncbi:hypothetical protein SAICODRAFT_32202 [Saitoella complicata NRRL Y-17804]|nr:uncharacterized protein SAICODRAFT_32202 [Saitoella complicata NRRL Y-17804]ODQ49864.1 hypothetical protein SAICODRAFT_32202 [Saitoella complicata NRRL Y-17804]